MRLAGMRVLVVEDEPIIAMMLEDYLTDLGCKVVAIASRLEDAKRRAAEIHIDLATLDVNLAGEVSYPVADILRSRNIPFIFATGYGVIGLPQDLVDVPVLVKPFSLRDLEAMLRSAMKP